MPSRNGSETDLRHAISLRPSPFHSHSESPHRGRPESVSAGPVNAPASPDSKSPVPISSSLARTNTLGGRSTAWEALTPPAEGTSDPISRRVESDVERQSTRRGVGLIDVNDPFRLKEKLKSEEEIERIRANMSKKRGNTFSSPLGKGKAAYTGKKLQKFYEAQNENIERLLKPVTDHVQEAKNTFGENELRYKIAVHGSLVANILLAGLQLYAASTSGSLALFTTMADALFDPLSNVSLILSHRAINRVDPRRFPSGKARIETAANIAFCFIMTAVSLVIIVQSIRDLVEGSKTLTTKFFLPSIIAVGVAFVTKLGLFLYCFAIRNLYSQIRILWEDHRNDLIINGTGIMFSLLGSHVRWWIDPAGAIVISCLIICLWLRTAHSEFLLLIGVTAETNILQQITYISMTHAPEDIKAIDTVRAYYSGPRLIVEVDVVMDAECTLKHTHDIAEALQIKLESLPNVERSYVHVDWEFEHKAEHSFKKEL